MFTTGTTRSICPQLCSGITPACGWAPRPVVPIRERLRGCLTSSAPTAVRNEISPTGILLVDRDRFLNVAEGFQPTSIILRERSSTSLAFR